jgi:single-stranded-DNA-specific exonuclease
MEKKWTLLPTDENSVRHLHKALRINPIFCRLLAQRGIRTYDEAKRFFRPALEHLHNPFLMKDMHAAAQRLHRAIQNGERILLYGDYDVDGTTCVALMRAFLGRVCPPDGLDYYIPNRYAEGYGVSFRGVDHAKRTGASLVIAMDCGIRAVDKVAYAQQQGIDFIICDHHLPSDTLPDAVAVLDPKRKDCPYPYKELSGCGVTFKLVQAYAQQAGLPEDTWNDLFDLLVVSIGCDIVQITGENRVMAYFGLSQINQGDARPGIRSLLQRGGRPLPISINDLVFGAGPMINAAGRLADAKEAVQLLLAEESDMADELAESLFQKNLQRREYEKEITEEACRMVEADEDLDVKNTLLLFQPHWHKGVLGIAASKITEQYHRPTIILTQSGNRAVGSARSVAGFDIHSAISQCGDLLENFGGHRHAAGLSLKLERLEDFRERLEEVAAIQIGESVLQPEIQIASKLNFNKITPEFWNILKQFGPFGPGNRRPVFLAEGVKDSSYSKVLKDEHLKLSVLQSGSQVMEGIGFWMGDDYVKVADGNFSLCYVLEENTWQGHNRLELEAKDIKKNGLE